MYIYKYMDKKGSVAMLAVVNRESAGVAPEVKCEESIASRQGRIQATDPSWLRNPRKMSPELQNSCISGPTKSTDVLQKNKKKRHITFTFAYSEYARVVTRLLVC